MFRSITFDTVGTHVWTVPTGVTAVWASGVSSGAGGSAAASQGGGGGNAGGGGGGGETVDMVGIPVSGGSVTVIIGAGGLGGITPSTGPTDGGGCSVSGDLTTPILAGRAGRLTFPPTANTNAFSGGEGGGAEGLFGQRGLSNISQLPAPGTRIGRHTGGAGGGSGANGPNSSQAGATGAGNAGRSTATAGQGGGGGANTRYGAGADGAGTGVAGISASSPGTGGGGAGTDPIASPGGSGSAGKITLFWIKR